MRTSAESLQKRLRIASPFKLHAAIQGRKDTLYGSGSSVAGPSRKSSRSGATGMESLASVAVAHDPRRNVSNIRRKIEVMWCLLEWYATVVFLQPTTLSVRLDSLPLSLP